MENCCCLVVVVEESLRFCDDVGVGVGVDLVGVRAMLGDDVVGCCWSEKATNVVLLLFVLLLLLQVVVLDICC